MPIIPYSLSFFLQHFLTCYLASFPSFPADLFTKALWKSQAEFLLGKLNVLNIHSNLRESVEDQTNKASAPTKSTKSDPINQQNQMQKEGNVLGL